MSCNKKIINTLTTTTSILLGVKCFGLAFLQRKVYIIFSKGTINFIYFRQNNTLVGQLQNMAVMVSEIKLVTQICTSVSDDKT